MFMRLAISPFERFSVMRNRMASYTSHCKYLCRSQLLLSSTDANALDAG
jgi:hypothetical protein